MTHPMTSKKVMDKIENLKHGHETQGRKCWRNDQTSECLAGHLALKMPWTLP
jgi:hypothetical protein